MQCGSKGMLLNANLGNFVVNAASVADYVRIKGLLEGDKLECRKVDLSAGR